MLNLQNYIIQLHKRIHLFSEDACYGTKLDDFDVSTLTSSIQQSIERHAEEKKEKVININLESKQGKIHPWNPKLPLNSQS